MSDRPTPEFVPIRPNPFIVGNPIRDRSMFFGREAEFELVRKRFSESARGGLLVFCGERRSGKTSILFQILDRRLGPDFIPVLIDMQSMAVANEIDFLDKLSREVLAALGTGAAEIAPPRFGEGSNHSATFLEFIQRVLLANPRKKLILLFDEYELFENKIAAGTLAEDVLYILANLMEHQSVFLVFTGSQHLEERRAEYWKILGKSIYKTISYLERRDALHLIQKPVEGRLGYGEGVVETIYRLTAGQAFYTQAVCQNLVDHRNDHRSNLATAESLAEVVDGIVNNPLPQMIFLWDGLDREEKLVLALLAESLPDARAHATVHDVARAIGRRGYPLALSRAQISTALEKLFKSEMLLRDDVTDPPGYSFRMDLWRLWIRRMHSVWQVMREEGLEIRGGGTRGRRRAVILVAVAALLGGALAWQIGSRSRNVETPLPAVAGGAGAASYRLEVDPDDAVIYQDGRRIGIGLFEEAIPAGRDHHFRITAPGYADSELTVRLPIGRSTVARLALRPLLGDLSIVTTPTGAEVRIDGRPRGTSPLVVRDLPVARPSLVEASLPGYGAARSEAKVVPGQTTAVSLTLPLGRQSLLVTSDPPGAAVEVDRVARGRSPVRLTGVALGRHTIGATLSGYVPVETTLAVTQDLHQIDLGLRREPPGVLVVQGDRPAQIYLDGVLIAENVQNSGPRELAAGIHQVRVVLVSGETMDQSVTLSPRERVVYDFSRNVVTRKTP